MGVRPVTAAASKKILIVDDDSSIREILATQLTRLKYQTYTASDGEEGLALFKTAKPDLVLMDVMMPRMDGLTACQKIRELEGEGGRTPILFLTARDTQHDKLSTAISGGDDFLPKPVAFQELRLHVESVFQKKRR